MHTFSKIILIVTVFGGLVGVLCMILGSFGALPDSLYVSFYQAQEALTTRFGVGPSSPAFEQYEGHWRVELQSNVASIDLLPCPSAKGYLYSHNASMQGVLHTLTEFTAIKVALKVRQDGSVEGTLVSGNQYTGVITATLTEGKGNGTWQSGAECSGTLSFSKVSPAVDPVAGRVVSTQGSVLLSRGGQILDTYSGMALYEGDVLTAGSGTSAHLGIGFNNTSTTVGAGTSYTVLSPSGK